jgi:hypothetical protein
MASDQITFAGMEISSGRKPVTFAALDQDLNVRSLEQWDLSEAVDCLGHYENLWLVINVRPLKREQEAYTHFRKKIIQAGFQPYPGKNSARQLFETDAQECFRALIGGHPLPRRTLEGRLQRSAVLYEQGLQINDPMDLFEEITRYKLVQGILPLEKLYSSRELDALVAAFLAWMTVNRAGQIALKGEFALPAEE